GSHAELATLSMLFSITAVAQIGWGAVALVRPTPPVLVAGLGVNVAAFGAWLTSRTVGLSAIEGLEAGQVIGFQDGLAAGFALLALAAGTVVVADVSMSRLGQAAVPAIVALLAFATVPAMAQPHDHGSHDHDDDPAAGGQVASAGGAVDGHVHGDDHDHADDDHHDDGHHDDDHHDDGHHGTADDAAEDDAPAPTAEELGYP